MNLEIKYRKGIPTQKSILQLTKEFFGDDYFMVYEGAGYGNPESSCLIWSRRVIQARSKEFSKFLNEKGIKTANYRPYVPPTTGSIQILPK